MGKIVNRYSSIEDAEIASRSMKDVQPQQWPVEDEDHSKMSSHHSCLAIIENLEMCWHYHRGTEYL